MVPGPVTMAASGPGCWNGRQGTGGEPALPHLHTEQPLSGHLGSPHTARNQPLCTWNLARATSSPDTGKGQSPLFCGRHVGGPLLPVIIAPPAVLDSKKRYGLGGQGCLPVPHFCPAAGQGAVPFLNCERAPPISARTCPPLSPPQGWDQRAKFCSWILVLLTPLPVTAEQLK